MNHRIIISIVSLAALAAMLFAACGSDNGDSPAGPSSQITMSTAGDQDDNSSGKKPTSPDKKSNDKKSNDKRSRDGKSDNFSNDQKSNDGSSSNDGDSSNDGNSFNRASGGYDGVNFRGLVQSYNQGCKVGVSPPCMTIVLKGVPITVVNETEIWDFRDPARPQITIEEFMAALEFGASEVKGEGLGLDNLDGVSLDDDGVSGGTFVAIEVDILN